MRMAVAHKWNVEELKRSAFADIYTKTLRTKLEPVHFGSEIQTSGFFRGKKKH
jgi:hypothetical protein